MNASVANTTVQMPSVSGRERIVHALDVLLNNADELISPPLPNVRFLAGDQGDGIQYVGPLSMSQYDRLNYLAQVGGVQMQVTPSQDHAEQQAFCVQLAGGNVTALENLAAHEQQRRARALEAEKLLGKATGIAWYWDGLCLSTPYPEDKHPAHQALEGFLKSGITQTPFDISVFKGDGQPSSTPWLSIHNLDMTRLKLIGQQIGREEMRPGR